VVWFRGDRSRWRNHCGTSWQKLTPNRLRHGVGGTHHGFNGLALAFGFQT